MSVERVLLAGEWRAARRTATFQAENPATCSPLPDVYPVSGWEDCESALVAAAAAAKALRGGAGARLPEFLEHYAAGIESHRQQLVDMAQAETGLPAKPRLADVELPRTINQLRLAAAAARDGSWALPTIDRQANIRSCYAPLGPVCVFGPNNFPFAFNSVAGGDFAAAIAAGNPVIAKANSSHPGTTRLFAEIAHCASQESELPAGTVQLLYRLRHEDGARLVADPRIGATAYTGSRAAGLNLKAAADAAGQPIYLELSSINPVVVLPGALEERLEALADEFTTSCLMGTGQFCTNPGLVILVASPRVEQFVEAVARRFKEQPPGILLSRAVAESLAEAAAELCRAGATVVVGGGGTDLPGYRRANTLLCVSAATFLRQSKSLQTEAFGNCSLLVIAQDLEQACAVIESLEGNLTGSIYSHTGGGDDKAYDQVASRLRTRVGRLLNDKMPTGVAVSPAMNHGGPYPATGHPGFTAVGIPPALLRFAMLECYDNVRPQRLPPCLRDPNPTGTMWRRIDGRWTQE
jgi:NADP-dependent aldehyde dehydrogenase